MTRTAPVEGDVLGRWRLGRPIGRGGSGVVFEARPETGGEPVAVKVLHPLGAETAGDRKRFAAECRLLARIAHPNVVRVLETGEAGGRLYLVSELLGGGTLARLLTAGALPAPRLKRTGEELLSALAALHGAGILHRDLTPFNVLFRGEEAVLVDFGLAQLVGEETLSRARGVRTTVAYAPPERLRGEACGPAADVYQAGLVLFEMATGRRCFDGETLRELVSAQLDAEPSPATRWAPALPPLVDRVLARALRKNPLERYAGVAEMLDDWVFVMGSPGRSG